MISYNQISVFFHDVFSNLFETIFDYWFISVIVCLPLVLSLFDILCDLFFGFNFFKFSYGIIKNVGFKKKKKIKYDTLHISNFFSYDGDKFLKKKNYKKFVSKNKNKHNNNFRSNVSRDLSRTVYPAYPKDSRFNVDISVD